MTQEFVESQETRTPQLDKLGIVMRSYLLELFQEKHPRLLSERSTHLQQKLKDEETGIVVHKEFNLQLNSDIARFLRINPEVVLELSSALEHIQNPQQFTIADYYYIGVQNRGTTWYKDPDNNLLWTPYKSFAALIHTEPRVSHDTEPAHIWFAETQEKPLHDASRRELDAIPQLPVPLGEREDDSSTDAQLWITHLLRAVAQATGTEKKLKKLEDRYLRN